MNRQIKRYNKFTNYSQTDLEKSVKNFLLSFSEEVFSSEDINNIDFNNINNKDYFIMCWSEEEFGIQSAFFSDIELLDDIDDLVRLCNGAYEELGIHKNNTFYVFNAFSGKRLNVIVNEIELEEAND